MKAFAVMRLAGLLMVAVTIEASASARADKPPACDETQPCILEGLDLDEQQAREIRDILEAARRKQDDLRDATYQHIHDLLTPGQGRTLDDNRTLIFKQRAEEMRGQAEHMQRRAQTLKDTP